MPNPLNITRIPGSRVALMDDAGMVSRPWFLFFENLYTLAGSGSNPTSLEDLQFSPAVNTNVPIVDSSLEVALLDGKNSDLQSQIATLQTQINAALLDDQTANLLAQIANLKKDIEGNQLSPLQDQTAINGITTTTPITSTGGYIPSIGMVNQGTTTTVLHGNAAGNPAFSKVTEDDIFLSNVTTNDATIARHGFLPILPNISTQFLNGQGNFATPSGTVNSYSSVSYTANTSFNVVHNFGAYPVVQVLITSTLEEIIPLTMVHTNTNQLTITLSVSTAITVVLTVGSPQPQTLTTVAAATYTVLLGDCIIKVSAALNVTTLLDAVTAARRIYYINNASTDFITVDTTSSQVINGLTSQRIPVDSTMQVYSDGSAWWII